MVAIAVFANTLPMDFVWDDHVIVTANRRIRSMAELPSLFTSHAFSEAGDLASRGERVIEYYRPVWTLSLALDYLVWKARPLGYHLTNVLLHALASLGFLLLARALLAEPAAALFAALLFAVHPVHTEAVAWVSARSEILAGLFLFISLYFYVRFRESRAPASGVLCVLGFVLALLSKESAVVMPALALLYELQPPPGRPRRLSGPLLLGVIAVAYLALRHALVRDLPQTQPLLWRLFTAPVLVAEYVRLLFVPFGLKVFYSVSIVKSPASVAFLLSLLALGVVIAVALKMRRRAPNLFFGIAWILIALVPVAGVVALLRPALMADRYLYVPSAGACLAAGALLMLWRRSTGAERQESPKRAKGVMARGGLLPAAVAIAVLGLLAFLTARQNHVWQSDRTLMTRMIRDAPRLAMGHLNLAVAEEKSGNSETALRELELAARLDPKDREVRRNLGIFYQKRERFSDAEREFRAELALKAGDPDARYGLGGVLVKQGRIEEGIRELEVARRLRPDDPDVHVALGAAYQAQGRLEEAAREYREALGLNPNAAAAHGNLGLLYQHLGRLEDASRELLTACRLDPAAADHRLGLALLYAAQGRHAEAERELRVATSLRPGWAEAHTNLGIALARQKRTREAMAEFERALQLEPDNPQNRHNLEVARRELGDGR